MADESPTPPRSPAAQLAHDLANPLHALTMALQFIGESLDDAERTRDPEALRALLASVREAHADATTGASRLSAIVDRLAGRAPR